MRELFSDLLKILSKPRFDLIDMWAIVLAYREFYEGDALQGFLFLLLGMMISNILR